MKLLVEIIRSRYLGVLKKFKKKRFMGKPLFSVIREIFSFLNWQLPEIDVGGTIFDLVVIGCGPAGLALAAESAKLGLTVGLVGPDLPFTNNYGVWEDEFRGLGFSLCLLLIIAINWLVFNV